MPAELILHSPPVYSPLLYGPLMVTAPTITSRSVPPRIRPCLSSGSLSLDTLRNSDGKQKKRVVFADDRGRPLTQVFPWFFLRHRWNKFHAWTRPSYTTNEFDDSRVTITRRVESRIFSKYKKRKTCKLLKWINHLSYRES